MKIDWNKDTFYTFQHKDNFYKCNTFMEKIEISVIENFHLKVNLFSFTYLIYL